MRRSASAWAALFTSACGATATGPGYQGPPLFTISGKMIADGTAPTRPIRLAVAWYADHATLGGPQAIVTQDVEYQGTFPLAYSFSFFGPPPDTALNPTTTPEGLTFRAAWGVLIAYEDLDGDGRLDVIPEGGSPIDQILATSIGDIFNGQPAPNPVRVAYIDGPPPKEALPGFAAGYNLYQGSDVALPSDTPAQLALSGAAGPSELDLFVCPDFVTGAYLASPNSAAHSYFDLPCDIPPTGGVRVAGTLLLANGVPSAWIRVTDGVNQLPQAHVSVNGTPLTYSAFDGVFEGTGSGLASADGGADLLAVQLADGGVRQFTLTRPGDFAIEALSASSEPRFLAGAPIDVNWTSAVGASVYTVSLIGTQPPYGTDLQRHITAAIAGTQQVELQAPDVDGPEWLEVSGATSDQPVFGEGGSVLFPGTYRSVYIDLAPADAGLGAFGQVDSIHDELGNSSSEVLVQPYDGAVQITGGAAVSFDGHAISWDPAQGAYYTRRVIFDAGTPGDIGVTVPDQSPFQTQVQVPGNFEILTPNAPLTPGQLLDLSWSPAEGAAVYNVVVEVADGGGETVLNAASTDGGGLSMVIPSQSGEMTLAVVALANQQDRHFAGAIQDQRQITVSSPDGG